MKEILAKILQRLEAACPSLKYKDLDWGQMDYFEGQPPVKFPCAVVDMREATCADEGAGTQRCIASIDVRMFTLPLSNSNPKAPVTQQAQALAIFDLHSEVHYALHGWCEANQEEWGVLTRIAYRKVKRQDNVREYIMSYKVEYVDNSTSPSYDLIPAPTPIITDTISIQVPPF